MRFYTKYLKMILFLKVNVAMNKLQSKHTVDSTQSLPISEMDQPPVITICPQNEQNEIFLQEAGYKFNSVVHKYPLIEFLAGINTY